MSTEDHTRPVMFNISSRVKPTGVPISVPKMLMLLKVMSKISIPNNGMAPYLSICEREFENLLGKIPKITLNPSKGGKGSRLNTHRSMFTLIRMKINEATKSMFNTELGISSNLISIASRRENIKFEPGPTRDINASPICGLSFLILFCTTGTGFPQPNPATRNIIEPMGSK